MDKEAWKDLLMKALFAAFYGAITELTLTQTFDTTTLLAALIGAGLRGLAVFFMTIKEGYDEKNEPVPTAGTKKGPVAPPKKKISRYF